MRLIFRSMACMILVLAAMCASGKLVSAAQSQELPPTENSLRGRQVLQMVIAALGGQAYLNVRDMQCDGRTAEFGAAGTLMGFTLYRDIWLLPDKNRVEYISKGEHNILGAIMGTDSLYLTHGGAVITVFSGNQGWTLDKSGVSNQPDDLIKEFNEQLKSEMNNMLRRRINEPGVDVEYAGTDLIDLKEAEWIEFTDSDRRFMRLGIDKFSHLPLRWVVVTRNPDTRDRSEAIASYTQYLLQDGIKTPLSIELSRNDHKISQTFLSVCKYNSDLTPQLFTRAALEQAAKEVTKKGYKDHNSAK